MENIRITYSHVDPNHWTHLPTGDTSASSNEARPCTRYCGTGSTFCSHHFPLVIYAAFDSQPCYTHVQTFRGRRHCFPSVPLRTLRVRWIIYIPHCNQTYTYIPRYTHRTNGMGVESGRPSKSTHIHIVCITPFWQNKYGKLPHLRSVATRDLDWRVATNCPVGTMRRDDARLAAAAA